MFILSNHIPEVDSNEEAVYNRYKQEGSKGRDYKEGS